MLSRSVLNPLGAYRRAHNGQAPAPAVNDLDAHTASSQQRHDKSGRFGQPRRGIVHIAGYLEVGRGDVALGKFIGGLLAHDREHGVGRLRQHQRHDGACEPEHPLRVGGVVQPAQKGDAARRRAQWDGGIGRGVNADWDDGRGAHTLARRRSLLHFGHVVVRHPHHAVELLARFPFKARQLARLQGIKRAAHRIALTLGKARKDAISGVVLVEHKLG